MNWFYKLFKKKTRFPTLKLTMKAIIRWEQMHNKPFSLLNYNNPDEVNEDEILSLFYVCSMRDNEIYSFEDFKKQLKKTDIQQMVVDFEQQIMIVSQFQIKDIPTTSHSTEVEKDTSPMFIKDIVSMLILNGLDAHFALNHMAFCDLPLFTQAYDLKERNRLTEQRLWSFVQLLPHLEKGAQPEDIYPFPWENKDEVVKSKETQEKEIETSKLFLQSGLNK